MPTVAKIAGKYFLKMSGEHNTEKRDKVAQVAGFMAQRYGFRKEVSVSLNLLGHFLASLKKPKHRCRKKSSGLGNLLQGSVLFNVKDNLVSWNLLDSSSEGSEEGPIVVDPTPTQLYDAIKALPEPPSQAAGQPGASKKRRQKPAESFDSPLSAKRQRTVDPPCSTLGAFTAANKTAPRIGANPRAVAGGAAAATAAAVVPAVGLLAPLHGPRGCGLAGSGLSGSLGPLPEQPLERAHNSGQNRGQRSVEAPDGTQVPAGQAFVPLPKELEALCQYSNTPIKQEKDVEGWRQQSAHDVAKYDTERKGWEAQHPGQRSVEAPDRRQVPAGQRGAQRPLQRSQERLSRLDGAGMAAAAVKIEPDVNQTAPGIGANPRAVAGGAAAATAAAVVPAVHLLAPPHGPRGCGLAGSGLPGSMGQLGAGMAATLVKIEPGAGRLDRAPLKELNNTELTIKLKKTEARLAAEKDANASLHRKCAGLEVDVVRLAKQQEENAHKLKEKDEMQGQLGGKVRSMEQLLTYEREQVVKLRDERETATRDTATLRADLDNTRQERDRAVAELAKAKEALDRVRAAVGKNAT